MYFGEKKKVRRKLYLRIVVYERGMQGIGPDGLDKYKNPSAFFSILLRPLLHHCKKERKNVSIFRWVAK